MLFKRKKANVESEIIKVNERLGVIRKEINNKKSEIAQKKEETEAILGQLAMEESPDLNEQLNRSRKALERMETNLSDLVFQESSLLSRREKLQKESTEALVRESEKDLEELAKSFNKNLDSALEVVQIFEGLYQGCREIEIKYDSLYEERQNAMKKTGVNIPLDMKEGMGRLSRAPAPYGFTFRIDRNNQGNFLNALLEYRAKMKVYEEQKDRIPRKPEEIPEPFARYSEPGFRI